MARQAPAPTRISGTLLRRPQSAVAARRRPPRVPGAAPLRKQGRWRRVRQAYKPATRARETTAAPLASRGLHSPAPPVYPAPGQPAPTSQVPAAAERAPTR